MSLKGTPALFSLGVFLCLILNAAMISGASAAVDGRLASEAQTRQTISCKPKGRLHKAVVSKVVDGDTLRLRDGRSIRLLGINTPELGRKGRTVEPLARRARNEVENWLSKDRVVWLQYGPQRKDRHGRSLAWVFHGKSRQSLTAFLLAKGMGFQVTVAPNDSYWRCFSELEKQASRRAVGVWKYSQIPVAPGYRAYQVLSPSQLLKEESGFRRLSGEVTKVDESRNDWWLVLDDRVAIQLSKNLANEFQLPTRQWLGKKLQIRGWLVWRGPQKYGYKPWVMTLSHPAMLEN